MASPYVNRSPYVVSSIDPLTTPLYIGDEITCRIEGSPITTLGCFGWGNAIYVWVWITWPPESGDIKITIGDYPRASMIMFSPSAYVRQSDVSRWDYIRAPRPIPIANFSGSPRAVQAGSTDLGYVQFVDESIGAEILSWEWSLPGCMPPYSFEPNPYRKYVQVGQFPVSLTVTGPGGRDTITKDPFVISTLQPPPIIKQAEFYAFPRSGNAPLTVSFIDASTRTPDRWSWSFGDGSFSTLQYPTHIYVIPGKFAVSLTTYWGTVSSTETKKAYVKIPAPDRPIPEYVPIMSVQIGPL